jgi:hypothetical protein
MRRRVGSTLPAKQSVNLLSAHFEFGKPPPRKQTQGVSDIISLRGCSKGEPILSRPVEWRRSAALHRQRMLEIETLDSQSHGHHTGPHSHDDGGRHGGRRARRCVGEDLRAVAESAHANTPSWVPGMREANSLQVGRRGRSEDTSDAYNAM